MPKFGTVSSKNLATCDERLQKLFNEVVRHFDCTVVEGHRSVARQQALFAQGRTAPGAIVTQLDGVNKKGKHNYSPSKAVDVVPYPVNWNDHERMTYFAGFVKGIAAQMGLTVRWGGDWDGDTETSDENFRDLPHFEVP
jgi:hypothetical protein